MTMDELLSGDESEMAPPREIWRVPPKEPLDQLVEALTCTGRCFRVVNQSLDGQGGCGFTLEPVGEEYSRAITEAMRSIGQIMTERLNGLVESI